MNKNARLYDHNYQYPSNENPMKPSPLTPNVRL